MGNKMTKFPRMYKYKKIWKFICEMLTHYSHARRESRYRANEEKWSVEQKNEQKNSNRRKNAVIHLNST